MLLILAARFFAAGIAELGEASVFALAEPIEEGLEAISHGLGNPWVMGALVLVPVGVIGWAMLGRRGSAPRAS